MVDEIWHRLFLNPEPWAIGSVTPRKGGAGISPNANLVSYQKAVKEELEGVDMLPETHRKITFYFWRQQARYLDMGDRVRQRNQADATNMQKALEDALQGVLFENDREVRDIRSVIIRQEPLLEPFIVIRAQRFDIIEALGELPEQFLRESIVGPDRSTDDNVWRGPGA